MNNEKARIKIEYTSYGYCCNMGIRGYIGCALMLTGMILSQFKNFADEADSEHTSYYENLNFIRGKN